MFILEFSLVLIGEVILRGTGELLLFAATLGRRKPRFRSLFKRRGTVGEELLTEAGFWVGVAFYAGLFVLANVFLR